MRLEDAMSIAIVSPATRNVSIIVVCVATVCIAGALWPAKFGAMLWFVAESFVSVAPLIGGGLLLSAWVTASGAGTVTANLFKGRPMTMIVMASVAGTITPVCGVTVLPLMAGLLASGVPLAPVMAFWLSSPVTDPGMFAATWATLGPAFAIGKTLAALGLGLFAGVATAMLGSSEMIRRPLRRSPRVRAADCQTPMPSGFKAKVWQEPERVQAFRTELFQTTKLVTVCLFFAFAAEFLLRDFLPADVLGNYVGAQSTHAIPLAVSVGAPMYLDGYAALPLVRGLLDLGMSPGAALAFLVSGSAVSIWGVLAVAPILRVPTVMLFVALAVIGSAAAGYVFEWAWGQL